MLPVKHWAQQFTIGAADIESITNHLLEQETPLTVKELATQLVIARENETQSRLQQRFQHVKLYRPCESYQVGEQLTFSQLGYAIGRVQSLRTGRSTDYSDITVAKLEFDDGQREFVVDYPAMHPLNDAESNRHPCDFADTYTISELLDAPAIPVIEQVNNALERNPDLVRLAGTWFVRELLLDVDIGHLHLAEAILDMHEGGPLYTEAILDGIGGIGDAPLSLQAFSLNYAMNQDDRFEEVGPAGVVQWHLTDHLPRLVRQVPDILHYELQPQLRSLLTQEMQQIEYDLDDEHSQGIVSPPPDEEVSLALIYPHRRVGTLPINSETRHIFPSAKTPRIAITIVDAVDKAEYSCWVVHEFKYVVGLAPLYQKYHLPVGAYVYLSATSDPSRIEIDFDTHSGNRQYIPIVERAEGNRLRCSSAQRFIGVECDEMIVVGVSNPQEIDQLGKDLRASKVTLPDLLLQLLRQICRQNPQGTVHSKLIYSALNIFWRCPPGPLLSLLVQLPEVVYIGDNNWKLRD